MPLASLSDIGDRMFLILASVKSWRSTIGEKITVCDKSVDSSPRTSFYSSSIFKMVKLGML